MFQVKRLLLAFVVTVALTACSDDSGSGPGGDGGGSFVCGSGLTCQAGEYCETVRPGQCGGSPPSDAGTCPSGCEPLGCPNGETVCSCNTRRCRSLPSGCSSCSCFTPFAGCFCQDSAGGVFVECAMP